LTSNEEVDQLAAQQPRDVRRVPHKWLPLLEQLTRTPFGRQHHPAGMLSWRNVELHANGIERNDRELRSVLAHPGVLACRVSARSSSQGYCASTTFQSIDQAGGVGQPGSDHGSDVV